MITAGNVIINLIILGIFKYFNFFISSFRDLFSCLGYDTGWSTLDILLPVGISFYTFQALSYTIDVYKQKIEPTRDIVSFFAFVSFFPQLVAGPIERATNLLPQMLRKRYFSYEEALVGLNLITYGFFKKIVVADRLAVHVNSVFGDVEMYNSITLITAVVFFTIQIYCDFSAYTDIARGVAKLFGFELMVNFNRPYLATTIKDFWKRWHISLTTWFTDYVYIPLGGNRKGKLMMYRNIFIVFLVSGIWHGANWTFVFWGLLHCAYQVLENIFNPLRYKIEDALPKFANRFLQVFYWGLTFSLIAFAWIFFRADSMQHAFAIINNILEFNFAGGISAVFAGKGAMNFAVSALAIFLLLISYLLPADMKLKPKHTVLVSIAFTLLIIFLSPNSNGEFIYFQF